ncbi:MAG TPA: hypothetical protein VJU61_16730 [Polyangiaceae bacterium]|nr:hypothetical protein [Polyangiaceae bacterium]
MKDKVLALLLAACAVDARQVSLSETPADIAPPSSTAANAGGAGSSGNGSGGPNAASTPGVTTQGNSNSVGLGGGSGSANEFGAGGPGGSGGSGGLTGLGNGMGGSGAALPVAVPPCAPPIANPPILTTDDVFETLLQDLLRLSPAAQLTTRYVILTNRSNAGAPECELDSQRSLLAGALQASAQSAVMPPLLAVDGPRLIYRIDLSDYGWDRPVTIDNRDGSTTDFTDSWEAVSDNSPFGLQFVGPAADIEVQATGTVFPFQYASAVIEQVLAGVPPAPAGRLEALRSDPAHAAALARLSAPVALADAAGDLGLSTQELSDSINLLDVALTPLDAGQVLSRATYAPLFLDALCRLSTPLANQPPRERCQ